MEVNEARRLKELEQENGQLKRLAADRPLDLSIHKDSLPGKLLSDLPPKPDTPLR